jgi:hypothetical protein
VTLRRAMYFQVNATMKTPAGPQELELFAREALLLGLERESIGKAMTDAGWTSDQARAALNAYHEVPFPVPVPRPRPQLSAREAFLYLLLFTTLYLSSYHLGSLLFDLINRVYPDAAFQMSGRYNAQSMRWSISCLVVAFPAFVFITRYIAGDLARHPVKRLSSVRRWLTYLTLFIAASALIGDLTTLMYNVLGGELTMRIVLKVSVVLLIAGSVFGYYLADLRKEEHE